MEFYPRLKAYIDHLLQQPLDLTTDRSERLRAITDHVSRSLIEKGEAHLNFICTHNSRRSQLAQVWAAVAADHYGIPNVFTWSGGTVETAFAPQAVASLERCGFRIDRASGVNPHYAISWSEERESLECFSKVYDDPFNPQKDFAAVMVCSQAESACPFVAGASTRISLPFNDPKEADNTPEESLVYDARNRQIARVIFHAFSQIQTK
jgi:arsenate reductase